MALYRKSGDWMVLWDDRYLMILAKEGPQTPSALADREHIHVSAPHTSHRLLKLADHGLVESLGNGVYRITSEGRLYLVGAYDVATGQRVTAAEGDETDTPDPLDSWCDELNEAIQGN